MKPETTLFIRHELEARRTHCAKESALHIGKYKEGFEAEAAALTAAIVALNVPEWSEDEIRDAYAKSYQIDLNYYTLWDAIRQALKDSRK